MAKDILKRSVADLLAILPLLHRTLRQKVARATYETFIEKITPIHGEIIRLLYEEGKLSMGDIGEDLMIAKAQLTQLIDKLVVLDVVERRAVKGDRRKIEITLTNTGKKLFRKHQKDIDKSIIDTMRSLTDQDLNSLSDSLTVVKDIFSKL
jgi:DNA-binding MarR family transcriptional regulator